MLGFMLGCGPFGKRKVRPLSNLASDPWEHAVHKKVLAPFFSPKNKGAKAQQRTRSIGVQVKSALLSPPAKNEAGGGGVSTSGDVHLW